MIVPYATGPVVAAAVENSGGEDNSGVLEGHTTGSEGHTLPVAEARTPRTHQEAGSECYKLPHKAGKVSDAHYLQTQVSSQFNQLHKLICLVYSLF